MEKENKTALPKEIVKQAEEFIRTIHNQVAAYNLNAVEGATAIAAVLRELKESE